MALHSVCSPGHANAVNLSKHVLILLITTMMKMSKEMMRSVVQNILIFCVSLYMFEHSKLFIVKWVVASAHPYI